MSVICLIEKECKNCLNCLEIQAGPLSVFIELGVFIIAKWVDRWVITCVVLPWRGVASRKEEFVLIKTCKKEKEESSGQWLTCICHKIFFHLS